MISTDYGRLSIALERGDDETANIRALIDFEEALDMGQAPPADSPFTIGGILSAPAFATALQREAVRCNTTRDPIAVLVVELDRELAVEEQLRLALQLTELAGNTGDLVGRTDRGFAVALPWIDTTQLRPLARTFEAMVRGALPNDNIRVGSMSAVPTPDDVVEFALPHAQPIVHQALARTIRR